MNLIHVKRILFILFTILSIYSCKKNSVSSVVNEDNGGNEGIEDVNVVKRDKLTLTLGNTGNFAGPEISTSGLWITANVNGLRSVNASRYSTSNYTNKSAGGKVFSFTKTELNLNPALWPKEFGALTDQNNNPIIYGDNIQWSAFSTDTVTNYVKFNNGIKGLKLKTYLFSCDVGSLANIVLVRFDLKNESSNKWSDVHIGLFNDDDFIPFNKESIGFDTENQIVFTYLNDSTISKSGSDSTDYPFIGHFVLKAPVNNIPAQQVYSSRKIVKYANNEYYEVIWTADEIYNALEGLGNNGETMINPITNSATKFAFTGNPVTKTGWIDAPQDGRNMLSVYPISEINSGETVTVVVGHIFVKNKSFEQAFNQMKEQVQYLRLNPSLWQ